VVHACAFCSQNDPANRPTTFKPMPETDNQKFEQSSTAAVVCTLREAAVSADNKYPSDNVVSATTTNSSTCEELSQPVEMSNSCNMLSNKLNQVGIHYITYYHTILGPYNDIKL